MTLDQIDGLIQELQSKVEEMKSEVGIAEEKGFVYARSKNIRKSAQEAKLAAQNIRIACMQLLKEKGGTE